MRRGMNLLLLLLFVGVIFYACTSNEDVNNATGNAHLRIYLTDAPADYKAVYVDIQEIRVNATDDAENGWVTLDNINDGVYNLLDLANGTDTLLADNELPSGMIKQIRLVLGDQNSVVDGDDSVAMDTPSAQQSGLKLQVNASLEPGITYDVLLDFDAAKSVVKAGNSGKYNLKPVIRTVVKALSGSIKGVVMPDSVQYALFAIMGEDSIGGFTDDHGGYMINGLDAGDYSLAIVPPTDSGIKDSTMNDINVQLGIVTQVDTVKMAAE